MSSAETTCDQAEEEKRLRATMLQDLEEMLSELMRYDPIEDINRHCDDLESLVALAAESTIESIAQQQEELLAKNSEYRNRLCERSAASASSNEPDEMSKFQDRVRELTEKIESSFSSQQLDNATQSLEELESKTEEFREPLRELRSEMKREAFGGEFMTFRVNNLYLLERGRFGSFVTSKDPEEEEKPKPEKTPTAVIHQEPLRTLSSPDGSVLAAMLHSDGFILGSFDDGSMRMWSEEFKETKVVTKGFDDVPLSSVTAFLELPNKYFLTGHKNGLITLWSKKMAPLIIFVGHTDAVCSLRLLKNGNFVSLSDDFTLKVWHQQLVKRCEPRISFKLPASKRVVSQVGVLSNGFLVTISEQTENHFVQIWDVSGELLVESFKIPFELTIASFIVLANDNLAISTSCGSLHVFNLVGQYFVKKIELPKKSDSFRLYELPNGFVLAASLTESAFIQVWDAQFDQLVQDFASEHTDGIGCCCVSPDGKTLITASRDHSLKTWSLSFD